MANTTANMAKTTNLANKLTMRLDDPLLGEYLTNITTTCGEYFTTFTDTILSTTGINVGKSMSLVKSDVGVSLFFHTLIVSVMLLFWSIHFQSMALKAAKDKAKEVKGDLDRAMRLLELRTLRLACIDADHHKYEDNLKKAEKGWDEAKRTLEEKNEELEKTKEELFEVQWELVAAKDEVLGLEENLSETKENLMHMQDKLEEKEDAFRLREREQRLEGVVAEIHRNMAGALEGVEWEADGDDVSEGLSLGEREERLQEVVAGIHRNMAGALEGVTDGEDSSETEVFG